MAKGLIKSTEESLRSYFKSEETISRLTSKIELLEQQIVEMEARIKSTDISIPEQPMGMSYSESVQTSRNNAGYAERQAIRIIEQMERELADKLEEVFLLEKIIRKTKTDAMDMGQKIMRLDQEAVKVLTLSYGEGKVDWKIGMEMSMSQSTAHKWRHRALKEMVEQDLRTAQLLNYRQDHRKG